MDCKEIQPVHSKGDQSWIFLGRTDVEAETPILWPPDVKNQLIWKDPDAGKDWRQEKGSTEDEMVGWHHWFNGHELGQAPGDSEGQGSLACWSPWGRKESDQLSDWTTTLSFLYLQPTSWILLKRNHQLDWLLLFKYVITDSRWSLNNCLAVRLHFSSKVSNFSLFSNFQYPAHPLVSADSLTSHTSFTKVKPGDVNSLVFPSTRL